MEHLQGKVNIFIGIVQFSPSDTTHYMTENSLAINGVHDAKPLTYLSKSNLNLHRIF